MQINNKQAELNNPNYNNFSDEQLVSLAQNGNDLCFELMINRYKQSVKNKSRRYFLIGADQEDLIQEGTIGLFKAIRDFDFEKQACFKTFADICIERNIITAIKTASRHKHSPLNMYISLDKPAYSDDSETKLMDIIQNTTSQSPEDLLISRETINTIWDKVLNNLSKLEQEVFYMYLDGISYAQMSQKLAKSQKSVDNALQRVKKKLAATIE